MHIYAQYFEILRILSNYYLFNLLFKFNILRIVQNIELKTNEESSAELKAVSIHRL